MTKQQRLEGIAAELEAMDDDDSLYTPAKYRDAEQRYRSVQDDILAEHLRGTGITVVNFGPGISCDGTFGLTVKND